MTSPRVPSSPAEETVAVVGVGLIGGSIAAALKQRGLAGRVIGVGRSSQRLQAARAVGLIDAGTTDVAEAARQSGLMIFCTPVDRIADGVRQAAPHCRAETLITDAGSVKGSICRELAGGLPDGVTFIGSHPLAGSEKQGFEHADADLFEGRVCVVTPDETTPREPLSRLEAFWRSLGMTVIEMSPAEHDRALAETSHVPHVVAAALASNLSDANGPLTATGFRDTTRIAAGDPELWSAILLANAEEINRALDRYGRRLARFRDALRRGDAAKLRDLLETARRVRDGLDATE